MAGSVTSPVNSISESVDSLVTAAGTTGIMKGAVGSRAVSGGVANVAAQEVATQVDDAAFTPATSTIIVAGALADQTSPDSVDEGDAGALRMTLARMLAVVSVADTATLSSVASQDTNITILAANANRTGAMIYNNDTGPLYLKFGATATATTSNTVKIAADGYYELPQPVYRGIIDGIWTTSGTGSANVTELT